MKKKFIFVLVLTALCVSVFSESKSQLQILAYKDSAKTLDFSKLESDYEFVHVFYHDICLSANLMNRIDRKELSDVCKKVYKSLKSGYKSQIVIKKAVNGKDLKLNFGQFPNDSATFLMTSNFNMKTQKIIANNSELNDSWAILRYIENGKLVRIDQDEIISAEEKLKKNLSELETDPKAITYMLIVDNYFELGEIKKGLAYLEENKDKALSLIQRTSDPDNIKGLISCLEQEGKVLLELR